MTVRKYLTRLGIVLAGAAVLTLAGCDLVYSLLGWKVDKGSVQVMQGSTDRTTGGTYDFGSLTAGLAGTPVDFTITNSGSVAVSLTFGNSVHAAAADFSVTPPTTTTVAPGGSTTFSVTFNPQSVGSISSTISVETSEGTITFTATGTGTASGTLVMKDAVGATVSNGATVSFAQLASLYATGSVTLTMNNTSGTEQLVVVSGPTLTTNNTGGAFYFGYPTSPIAASGSTSVTIYYQDLGPGRTDNETMQIRTSDGSNQVFTLYLSGTTQ